MRAHVPRGGLDACASWVVRVARVLRGTARGCAHRARRSRGTQSMDGAARVAIYAATRIVHCYTLEVNYAGGRPGVGGALLDGAVAPPPPRGGPPAPKYGPSEFHNIGAAVGEAVLELRSCHPWSRVPRCEQRSLAGLRERIMRQISVDPDYRDAVKELRTAAPAPAGGGGGGGSRRGAGASGARVSRVGAGGGTVLSIGFEVSVTPVCVGDSDGAGDADATDGGGGAPVPWRLRAARREPRTAGTVLRLSAVDAAAGVGADDSAPAARGFAPASLRRLRSGAGSGGSGRKFPSPSPVVPPRVVAATVVVASTHMPPLIPTGRR